MSNDFYLPEGVLGRFGVVKLWPGIKTAEDECIARMKIAASSIGVECVEVNADGSLISDPHAKVNTDNVDFVIHLHYDTPKNYDAFSFVALWNPLKFYHEWGYQRCSRNLTTHDDFVSCSSRAADDHVARMVRGSTTHLAAKFKLYHSTPDVIHPPSLGDGKLFYAGINWEAIVSSRQSRQQEVLKRLDPTGLLKIYGPTIFQGVRVWEGYQSYVREIPFDGFSMIDEISTAGAALVLSSQAHRDSELMSNRLFETIAAGTLVICDENPFAKRFFGESLLYIDSRSPMEQIYADITNHLIWIKNNPELALEKIAAAQSLFRQNFTLIGSMKELYLGLNSRKTELRNLHNAGPGEMHVSINLLLPAFSRTAFERHIRSVSVQDYGDFTATIVVDKREAELHRDTINEILNRAQTKIKIKEVDGYTYSIHSEIQAKRPLGITIEELIHDSRSSGGIVFVAPNEQLMSNHLSVLSGALQNDQSVNCAATAAILTNDEAPIHGVHELIDYGHVDEAGPPGFARFIFRVDSLPQDLNLALPYLDRRPLAALIVGKLRHLLPATVSINLSMPHFPAKIWDDQPETEVIRDYNPDALKLSAGFYLENSCRAVATQSTPVNFARLLLNTKWLKAQLHAVRTQGLSARLKALKRKINQ